MSEGWANSFFEIVCENEVQAEEINDILNAPKNHKFFTSWRYKSNDSVLGLDLVDSELYGSFDEDVEEFYKWIKDTYNLKITGYMLEEVNGFNYRCEFDENGKLKWEEINWLSTYTIEQIKQIKHWASTHFDSKKSEAKLKCHNCGKLSIVSARMEKLEYCNVNVLVDKEGHCELDWENAETSGDFEYCCEFCGEKLAGSLDEVEEKLKSLSEDTNIP